MPFASGLPSRSREKTDLKLFPDVGCGRRRPGRAEPGRGHNLRQMLEILLAQGTQIPAVQELHRRPWHHPLPLIEGIEIGTCPAGPSGPWPPTRC